MDIMNHNTTATAPATSPPPEVSDSTPSSPRKNMDVLAKRRRQNREAQRAYRERKANRIQVLERSMNILQDMVTSWEKKYNDLKVQYDEQNIELNSLKLQLKNEDRSSIASDSTIRDFDRNTNATGMGPSSNPSTTNTSTNALVTVTNSSTSESANESHSIDPFERIKRHMTGDPQQQTNLSLPFNVQEPPPPPPPMLNLQTHKVTVLPSPSGVNKPLHLPSHPIAGSNSMRSNCTTTASTSYNSLLFMLDSISKKKNNTVLPPLKETNNSEKIDKEHSPSSSVTLH